MTQTQTTSRTTNRRRSALLAVVGVAAVIASVAVVPFASADEFDPVAIPARGSATMDFPPIVGQEPATVTAGVPPTPPECAMLPSCHLVPLDIEDASDRAEGDDFLAFLEISWNSQEGANDLDVYVWDDQQLSQREGGTAYTEVGSAASSANPEIVKLFEPNLGRYNLTVINFVGPNLGWTLNARSEVVEFTTPFESLDPDAPPPASDDDDDFSAPTTTTTTAPPPPASTGGPPTTSPPTLGTADVPTDVDFSSGEFGTLDDFDAGLEDADALAEQLAAAEALASLEGGGDPPSALTLLFWLLFVPLALVGAAVAVVARRNPGALGRILPHKTVPTPT